MRDQRLDLGRYVRNPFNKKGDIGKRLDFHALFKENARSGRYPWNPDRFDTSDLLKRQQTRKLKLNPDLNFVGNSPFFDENQQVTSQYELFEGVGRFNRPEAYDFAEGRPLTPQRPQNQPDFNPFWVEAYRISPTLPPDQQSKNPMPRDANPDPNGFLMEMAQQQVTAQVEGDATVAGLEAGQQPTEEQKAQEVREGEELVAKTEQRKSE
jgi:hypothetical protein